jgi:hypothetical protein
MIADLHCHYPMHLLPGDEQPHRAAAGWLGSLAGHLRAEVIGIAAHLLNDPRLSAGWRVDLDGLVQGQARLVCSVLYWPAGEFRVGSRPAGLAQHQLGSGTDLDGFIKPTLAGLERASDLPILEGWIRAICPGEADAILHDNASRVVRQVFAARA